MLRACYGRGVAPEEPQPRRFVGLKNQNGTTCHLNTVLQALFMTPEFREGLLGLPTTDLPPTTKAASTVFARMAQANRTVSTKPLTSALRPIYTCTRQQDCHDTWLMLVDQVETGLKKTCHAKLVSDLFEGTQTDYVRCHACGTVTNTNDTFSNLSLAVPYSSDASDNSSDTQARGGGDDGNDEETDEEEEDNGGDAKAAGAPQTVTKCIKEFLKPEQLRGDDKFECDKCKCKQDAERGVRLRTMPPIVSVHLKRFAIQNITDRRGRSELSLVKVNTAVHFPRVLDMRPFVNPEAPKSGQGHEDAASSGGNGDANDGTEDPSGSMDPPSPGNVQIRVLGGSSGGSAMLPTGGEGGGDEGATRSGPPSRGREATEGDAANTTTLQYDGIPRSDSLLYDLYAVLLHSGSLEKGHYFALIQDVADGSWYRFDDEKVTHLTSEQLERELKKAYGGRGSTSAYMLFYREMPTGGQVEEAAAEPTNEAAHGSGGGPAEPDGLPGRSQTV